MIPTRIRAAGALLAAVVVCSGLAHGRRAREVSACGARFEVPAHWRLRSTPPGEDETCAAEVRLESMQRTRDSLMYRVWLSAGPGGFAGAAERNGFRRRRHGWIVQGRMMMESPAHESTRRGLRLLRGDPWVGWFDEHGYAGLAEVSRAVVCRGDACLSLEGGPQSDAAFDRILATVRFPGR